MGVDHHRDGLVGVKPWLRKRAQQGSFLLEAIDWPLPGAAMLPDVGNFVSPVDRQAGIIFPAGQLIVAALQGVAFDVANIGFYRTFRFGIPTCAGKSRRCLRCGGKESTCVNGNW